MAGKEEQGATAIVAYRRATRVALATLAIVGLAGCLTGLLTIDRGQLGAFVAYAVGFGAALVSLTALGAGVLTQRHERAVLAAELERLDQLERVERADPKRLPVTLLEDDLAQMKRAYAMARDLGDDFALRRLATMVAWREPLVHRARAEEGPPWPGPFRS
jgi:hypothetical protein